MNEFVNVAGYRFIDLPDRDELRQPFRDVCEKNRLLGTILLSTEGSLWSWTVQRFPPASPPFPSSDGEPFEPFTLGYVELPGEVRVISRLFYKSEQSPLVKQLQLISYVQMMEKHKFLMN